MAAKKKAEAKASEPSSSAAPAANQGNAVEPVAIKQGVPTYRTDLGESLPPQKHPGVE